MREERDHLRVFVSKTSELNLDEKKSIRPREMSDGREKRGKQKESNRILSLQINGRDKVFVAHGFTKIKEKEETSPSEISLLHCF